MAAKKKNTSTGKAMVDWKEELAKRAQVAQALEKDVGGGNFISTRGGQLSYNGAVAPGNKISVIILDHILENVYYTDRFDPDNPQSPAAFALGRDAETLRWHENSIEEYAGELCKDSDINQWGSADTGRGKACKNQRRLALIPEDALEHGVEDAEIALLKVPVTSVKAWAGYVRTLASMDLPPLAVVTEIRLVPDPKNQFRMEFKMEGTIDDGDAIQELLRKAEEADGVLMTPYAPHSEEEAEKPAQKPSGRGPLRKGTTAKARR